MHLAQIENKSQNCCEAKKYFDEVLEIFKKEKYPIIYSMILEHFETLKGICNGKSD